MVEFARGKNKVDEVSVLRELLGSELELAHRRFEPMEPAARKAEFLISDFDTIASVVGEFLLWLKEFQAKLAGSASPSRNAPSGELAADPVPAQFNPEISLLDETFCEQFSAYTGDIMEVIELGLGAFLFPHPTVADESNDYGIFRDTNSQINLLDASQVRQVAAALSCFNALVDDLGKVSELIKIERESFPLTYMSELAESGNKFLESSEEIVTGLRHLVVGKVSETDLGAHNFPENTHHDSR